LQPTAQFADVELLLAGQLGGLLTQRLIVARQSATGLVKELQVRAGLFQGFGVLGLGDQLGDVIEALGIDPQRLGDLLVEADAVEFQRGDEAGVGAFVVADGNDPLVKDRHRHELRGDPQLQPQQGDMGIGLAGLVQPVADGQRLTALLVGVSRLPGPHDDIGSHIGPSRLIDQLQAQGGGGGAEFDAAIPLHAAGELERVFVAMKELAGQQALFGVVLGDEQRLGNGHAHRRTAVAGLNLDQGEDLALAGQALPVYAGDAAALECDGHLITARLRGQGADGAKIQGQDLTDLPPDQLAVGRADFADDRADKAGAAVVLAGGNEVTRIGVVQLHEVRLDRAEGVVLTQPGQAVAFDRTPQRRPAVARHGLPVHHVDLRDRPEGSLELVGQLADQGLAEDRREVPVGRDIQHYLVAIGRVTEWVQSLRAGREGGQHQ
jgi:hypothetical protein